MQSQTPDRTVPHVSAVICTRNRHDKIASAVAGVLANDYPSFDLTVIDQSTSEDTRLALEPLMASDERLHYHFSEQAGLSRAYNTGVSVTTGELLAFTDDDCRVPKDWISKIVAALLDDPEADLLYGAVRPLERNQDDARLTPVLAVDRPERIGRTAGKFRVFGMGANFAARRRLFERIGPFDEILGGGGPLRSSQDFDMTYRTYAGGSVIALRPEVWIEHDGRREAEDWPSLLRAYGVGDGAYYSKHVRCRDLFATWVFARHIASSYGKFAMKWLLRRQPADWPYLSGIAIGVRDGFKFRVNRSTRLYEER